MTTLLILLGLSGVVFGLFAFIRGHVDWARIHSRGAAVAVVVASFALFVSGGALGASAPAVSSTAAPPATPLPTASSPNTAATSSPSPSSSPPAAPSSSMTDPLAPDDAAPVGLKCSDVGGVFVPHGTDGRGDCMSADPRPVCHIPPVEQDENYLAELTMTPPFPDGTIDDPYMISMASNRQCWHQP